MTNARAVRGTGRSYVSALKDYRRALVALILRDVKTRFFGSAWGYLISLGWPLTHIAILLAIYSATGRLPPYGTSAAVWFSTGIVPFMAFSYMSRFMMLGLIYNRPLLIFPLIKLTDILFARAIVEVLSAGAIVLILMTAFLVAGIDFMPYDLVAAFRALGLAMLLGLGFGCINSIIAQAAPMWSTGYALVIIILWMASGVVFIPDNLPEPIRDFLSYNPVLQAVTAMRAAYYEGYGSITLDESYLFWTAMVSLFMGLGTERLVRGRLLQG